MAETSRQKRLKELGVASSTSSPSASTTSREQRKANLGITPASTTDISSRQKRKMDLGVIPDIRPQIGKNQVASYQQGQQQFNPMLQDTSRPFTAPFSSAPSIDPSHSPVMQEINQYNVEHPVEPTWNGIGDNPITNAVKTGGKAVLDNVIIKPIDSAYTAIADGLGAVNNAIQGSHPGWDGEQIFPSEKRNLGKDLHDIWHDVPRDHSPLEGALPNDFLDNKRLHGTTTSLGQLEDAVLQNAIPLPGAAVIKGAKGTAGAISKATKSGLLALGEKHAGTKLGDAINSFVTPEPLSTDIFNQAASSRNTLNLGEIDRGEQEIVDRYNFMDRQTNASGDQLLQLNPSKYEVMQNEAKKRSMLEPNSDPIHGKEKEILKLPESDRAIMEREAQRRSVLEPNTNPIYGNGEIYNPEPLGLPEGKYVSPERLKVLGQQERFTSAMDKVLPVARERLIPPLENENELAKWVQGHLNDAGHDVSLNEVRKLNYEDLRQLAEEMKPKIDITKTVKRVSDEMGYGKIFDETAPSLKQQMEIDANSRVYGVPAPKVNINRPDSFNVEHVSNAALIETKPKIVSKPVNVVKPTVKPTVKPKQHIQPKDKQPAVETLPVKIPDNVNHEIKPAPVENPVIEPVTEQTAKPAAEKPKTVTVEPDHVVKGKELKELKVGDEPKFINTVKNSEHTDAELVKRLESETLVGARTTDVLNRQNAAKLIKKHGSEKLYSILMAKKLHFSPAENTAAQILAKEYSSAGGDEFLTKAIDLISKTAKGGREMGQAIQALSQWNKLDAEGALLLGERQLNKGVHNTEDWKKLTAAQGKTIVEPTERIAEAAETKSLADEVLAIVTDKKQGEAFTTAEKAKIKEFQDQVKLINEKSKKFLPPDKVNVVKENPTAELKTVKEPKTKPVDESGETIKQVQKIKPKERTRDQVVNFLNAKAEKARARLAASRNLGFAATTNNGNPIVDWSIIGASHIANKIVKLSDFTEAMVKDFGEVIRPHINEVFTKATNVFRRENGLPTVDELDRVVNNALQGDTAAYRKAYDEVIEKYKTSGMTETEIKDLADQAGRDASSRFSPEDAKRFKAWASEIGYMSENFKREATQDLQAAMKELGDSTLGNKLATLQTGAQLLNFVTVGRNIVGNAALVAAEKINKVTAVPIDWTLSKLTGERTIQFNPHNQEKMMTNFLQGTGGGWKGVSPSGTLDSYGIHPNVFGKKNPLKYVSKALGASMQGFDHVAYRQAYGDVLATYGEQLGKAQGLSKAEIKATMPKLIEQLDSSIFELADEAGTYATFQDETLLSQGAEMLKKGLNKITDMPAKMLTERGLLPKSLSTEGFGLGDVVLKYAKTPANLVMRALDYSPVGFLRSAMEIAPLLINRGKFDQFRATRALSRAITGTLGLTGFGYILANAGVLTGSSSMDKDTRSIQEQSGQGAYKVNWSALSRFVTSGFDKEAAKFQEGDHLMDYAWLQPAAISIAMGVNANEAVKDKKNGDDTSGWDIIQKSLLGGLQTVLENPMIQGVSSVVDAGSDIIKKQDPTKLKNIGKGVPASFIPTLSNQARASTDNKQRETFDKNVFVEMANLVKNKIPGASKTLPVSYDSLGHERERIIDGEANTVGQYLTAFFSPARMTEFNVSPEAKTVLDLMKDSGDQNVLPHVVDRFIEVTDPLTKKEKRINLDAEQFSELQKSVGQQVEANISKYAIYFANPDIKVETKVKKMKEILTNVGSKARNDVRVKMGYKTKKTS